MIVPSEQLKGFIQSIRKDPTDSVNRHVLADYLEDHSDNRAKYVRMSANLIDDKIKLTVNISGPPRS